MKNKVKKLTPQYLKRLIKEESAKLSGKMKPVEDEAADEVDANEYGTSKSLEKDIDHLKALKIREAAYRKALKKLREEKARRFPKRRSETMNESQLLEALKKVRAARKAKKARLSKLMGKL